MLCPVCKNECGNNAVCAKCGFDQLQVEFLSREEAAHWINNVVVPYREKWQSSQMVMGIDWEEVLFRQKEIRYFFDVTIAAATSKNDVIGHILLICPYPRLREQFMKQLEQHVPYRNIRDIPGNQKLKMGDVAAILSSHTENDFIVLNPKALPTDKAYSEYIRAAFNDFMLVVPIGKGAGAREVHMDLPKFTWIAAVDKMADVPEKYHSIFENQIEIKHDKCEICKLEVNATAIELGVRMHQTAVDLIASQAKYDANQAATCVKRIGDYLLVKGIESQVVTEDLAKEILSQFM